MTYSFFSASKDEVRGALVADNHPKFRADQIWDWVYSKGIRNFQEMTNLALKLRLALAERFLLDRADTIKELLSLDGTRKWLLKFPDGNEIETVFIPEDERGTLCISSQVGCTLTCKFCHTGTQKLVRNLHAGEIIAQLMYAKDALNDWPVDREGRVVTNVVMMGMGEPLLNYENVAKAITIFLDHDGLNMSKHKITLSTSGIVPGIKQCATDLGVNLAISLHATNDQLRDHIVPINKKYPIKELLESCRYYATHTNYKRITFEYVMLEDINDSTEDAKALVKLLFGIPAKINIIPFNYWPGAPYKCSRPEVIRRFAEIVEEAGYQVPVRVPRGQDIMAACGQLKSESVKKSAMVKKEEAGELCEV